VGQMWDFGECKAKIVINDLSAIFNANVGHMWDRYVCYHIKGVGFSLGVRSKLLLFVFYFFIAFVSII